MMSDRPDPPPLLHVVLFAPRMAQNVGQIARTCLAMNLKLHLIRPLGFRMDEAHLRRAGVGYWDELDPVIHADGDEFWRTAPDASRVFQVSKHGRLDFWDVSYRSGDRILLGNESEGLPKHWLDERPGQTLRIPMKNPRVRCLNLATAATAVMLEAIRQIERG